MSRDKKIRFFKAPSGWSYNNKNPFTKDGNYGQKWTSFCILDRSGDRVFVGRGTNGLYSYRLSRDVKNMEHKLADFLRYENAHGRNVILSFPRDIDTEAFANESISETPEAAVIRENDPKWVVHSTNLEAWKQIQRDGELRSLSRLLKEGKKVKTIGFHALGEPSEYADYVMLGSIYNRGTEMVLSSNMKGRICLDENMPYEPGVRLYFDNHAIIRSSLGVRDGEHIIKVHDHLPLKPFLLMAVGINDVDPERKVKEWTPKKFVEVANKIFLMKIRMKNSASES
jgi:hypothetical protein